MEYIVPTLLGLVLGYVGYLLGRRSQPQNQADLALQQELTGTKALLTAAESRRTQDTSALQAERDNALARANAAEAGLARADEAKAAAQRSLEETKLSFGELEKRMREAFANAAQSQLAQSREQFIGMAEQKFAPFKSQLDELTRLLCTAVECMGNATAHPHAAQMLEDDILGTAYMQDDRQIEVTGDAQLLDEEAFMTRRILHGNKPVQADFAHANKRWLSHGGSDRCAQCKKVVVMRTIDTQWMDPQRKAYRVVSLSQRMDRSKIAPLHGGHHDA